MLRVVSLAALGLALLSSPASAQVRYAPAPPPCPNGRCPVPQGVPQGVPAAPVPGRVAGPPVVRQGFQPNGLPYEVTGPFPPPYRGPAQPPGVPPVGYTWAPVPGYGWAWTQTLEVPGVGTVTTARSAAAP